ncbi:hypothetical protein J6590_043993 [Homalodisca vitripennis]|nr:hypothetical protein J6590_043993 [Homalodisca vitripennis]
MYIRATTRKLRGAVVSPIVAANLVSALCADTNTQTDTRPQIEELLYKYGRRGANSPGQNTAAPCARDRDRTARHSSLKHRGSAVNQTRVLGRLTRKFDANSART